MRFVFPKAQISIVTQLQRIAGIWKKILVASWFVAVCVHCLFLMVLWVGLESVIVFFSAHTHLQLYFPVNKDKNTDQIAWLRRLFCAFVFRI